MYVCLYTIPNTSSFWDYILPLEFINEYCGEESQIQKLCNELLYLVLCLQYSRNEKFLVLSLFPSMTQTRLRDLTAKIALVYETAVFIHRNIVWYVNVSSDMFAVFTSNLLLYVFFKLMLIERVILFPFSFSSYFFLLNSKHKIPLKWTKIDSAEKSTARL